MCRMPKLPEMQPSYDRVLVEFICCAMIGRMVYEPGEKAMLAPWVAAMLIRDGIAKGGAGVSVA